MNDRFFALLVYDRPHPLESLKTALKDLSVETRSVRTCEEVRHLVPRAEPHVIFTDTSLPDGSWADVVGMAEKARSPVNVIVVGANENAELYVSALERGAFDFLLPPFERQALEFVVDSARYDVRRRSQGQALSP